MIWKLKGVASCSTVQCSTVRCPPTDPEVRVMLNSPGPEPRALPPPAYPEVMAMLKSGVDTSKRAAGKWDESGANNMRHMLVSSTSCTVSEAAPSSVKKSSTWGAGRSQGRCR